MGGFRRFDSGPVGLLPRYWDGGPRHEAHQSAVWACMAQASLTMSTGSRPSAFGRCRLPVRKISERGLRQTGALPWAALIQKGRGPN